jgi:hypothetical protein
MKSPLPETDKQHERRIAAGSIEEKRLVFQL